ncbi:hypothetical protein THRCLA_08172, partial [Thraustotheca clavata]
MGSEGKLTRVHTSLVLKEKIAEIQGHRAQENEILTYHAVRESILAVSTTMLQEIDVRTGAVLGEIPFEICLTGGDKLYAFDDLVPCGLHYVIATFSRFIVVWNLREMTLWHIAEATKSHSKGHIAIAASLSSSNTIFYGHEGSQSVKVTTVEALCNGEACKKIPRKVISRNSSICALAFDTKNNILVSGSTDGMIHIWRTGVAGGGQMEEECSKDEHSRPNGEDISPHTLLSTINSKPSTVQVLCLNNNGVLTVGYGNNQIDVFDINRREPTQIASQSTTIPSPLSLYKRHSILFSFSLNTLLLVLVQNSDTVDSKTSHYVLHRMHYGLNIDSSFGVGMELDTGAVALVLCDNMLTLYTSLGKSKSLSLLQYAPDDIALSNVQSAPTKVWCEQHQFAFSQYCNPDKIPSKIIQITTTEEVNGKFYLASMDLKTSEKTTICSLPTTFEGLPLTPLRMNTLIDTVVVLLESTQATVMTVIGLQESSSQPLYEVRDFAMTPTQLVSLAPSGRSIRIHNNWKAKEPDGLLLTLSIAATRIFPTRNPIINSDTMKLLFITNNGSGQETLRQSDQTMAFTLESTVTWTTQSNERIIDVQNEPEEYNHLIAVCTTCRIVVLEHSSLTVVASYAPSKAQLYMTPRSILWIGKAIAFATTANSLYYFAMQSNDVQLLCCLQDQMGQKVINPSAFRLIAFLPDRFLYMTIDEYNNIKCNNSFFIFTRPFAPVEPLIYSQPKADSDLTTQYLLRLLEYGAPLVQVSNKLIQHLGNDNGEVCLRLLGDGKKAKPGAMYRENALVSTQTLCSLFLAAHRWKDAVMFALSDDPSLQEYVSNPQSSEAQLPQRLSHLASRLNKIGNLLQSFGQLEWAGRCFDIAGNDQALIEMCLKCNKNQVMMSVLENLKQSNPVLCASVMAHDTNPTNIPAKMDPVRLLSTDTQVFERRSRLLQQLNSLKNASLKAEKASNLTPPPESWKFFTWKRLEPEDTADWLGSPMPHYSSQEFVKKALHIDTTQASNENSFTAFADNKVAGNTSIGPFLDDEDSVMAYWRFEDAATFTSRSSDTQLLDTSKRENHITVSSLIGFELSSAPVDKGESGKLLPEYALHFPEAAIAGSEWSARCNIRKGGTLDFGTNFDEDPYRRHLTLECWLRCYIPTHIGGIIASRSPLWSLSMEASGHLVLQLHDRTLKGESIFQPSNNWQHIAMTFDVLSDDKVSIRLTIDGVSALSKEIAIKPLKDAESNLLLGPQLIGFEMTEIRLWATTRSVEQINDMKENYLGIAENKKRIK